MRSYWFLILVFLSVSALAADLTVKVVDPQSGAVAAAQVELFKGNTTRTIAVKTTSAQGLADFQDLPSNAVRIHVLAPGFAEQWQSMASGPEPASTVTITVKLAVATESVVVTATRT